MPSLVTYKFRLYPSERQIETLERTLAGCQELYNAALQERRAAWRTGGKSVNFVGQSAQLSEVKGIRPEFNDIYSQVLQDVLHRVDMTFKAFFGRVKRGTKAGFPRFRSRERYDSFTYPQFGFCVQGTKLHLSKVGKIKIKLHRPIEGKIKTCTIKREAGKWYTCFAIERPSQPLPQSDKETGIDVGLLSFATLSDGSEIENPRYYREAQVRLRVAQRKVARRHRGSRRRKKAILELQRAHAHVKNQRTDFQHKKSRELVDEFGFIAVEDLNIKGLAGGMLAKSIHDVGWSGFINKLAYKAEEAGRTLMKVDPRGTSQRCVCGAPNPKDLSQRWHQCQACGLSVGRDHASALEILRLGLSLQALRGAMAPFA